MNMILWFAICIDPVVYKTPQIKAIHFSTLLSQSTFPRQIFCDGIQVMHFFPVPDFCVEITSRFFLIWRRTAIIILVPVLNLHSKLIGGKRGHHPYNFKPSGVETGVLRVNQVDTMALDINGPFY